MTAPGPWEGLEACRHKAGAASTAERQVCDCGAFRAVGHSAGMVILGPWKVMVSATAPVPGPWARLVEAIQAVMDERGRDDDGIVSGQALDRLAEATDATPDPREADAAGELAEAARRIVDGRPECAGDDLITLTVARVDWSALEAALRAAGRLP